MKWREADNQRMTKYFAARIKTQNDTEKQSHAVRHIGDESGMDRQLGDFSSGSREKNATDDLLAANAREIAELKNQLERFKNHEATF